MPLILVGAICLVGGIVTGAIELASLAVTGKLFADGATIAGIAFIVGGLVGGVLLLGGPVAILVNLQRRARQNPKPTKYLCELCGFRWEHAQGDPMPTATVRPDLMARGAQDLERRRRMMDD